MTEQQNDTMSVDVSRIEKGDKVRVSMYGLPVCGWLKVKRTSTNRYVAGGVLVETPKGGELWVPPRDIDAHEPYRPGTDLCCDCTDNY